MLAPLFARPELALVKGAFARPFARGGELAPGEGGRVTELTARPLLNLHRPELAGFAQPLAGEIAARRELLERLAFPVGYGVEIAMLIDALEHAGIDALAEADLGTRQNRHQSLHELSRMSYAVLVAASRRLLGEDAVEALGAGPLRAARRRAARGRRPRRRRGGASRAGVAARGHASPSAHRSHRGRVARGHGSIATDPRPRAARRLRPRGDRRPAPGPSPR